MTPAPSDDVRPSATVERTRELLRSLAMLDAIIEPEWEARYHSFDAHWDAGEQIGSMRNGQGDGWFCWFGPAGAAFIGCDHETPRPDGLTDRVPEAFHRPVLDEVAFSPDEATFLLWRSPSDDRWHGGGSGHAELLALVLADDADRYAAWASGYFEVGVDPGAVARIWRSEPLTEAIVTALNPELSLDDVDEDRAEIGYCSGR